jgi:tRNA modification GTPase
VLHDPLNMDTITAIATPLGLAGIGVVRISGPDAKKIAGRLFKPKRPLRVLQTHRLYLGRLIDPESGEMVDEVLLSFMKAPNSYTREDVVEINSHSGYLLLSRILRMVLREGARLAEPGEFTFRAFMNGRIDLSQAEAIVDLIHSPSEKGLRLASAQMEGRLRMEVERLRQKAMDLLARIEVSLDYPDEETDALLGIDEIMEEGLIQPIRALLAAHGQRKVWMEGIETVIVGRVNVGKSSLLNRLLNEERAIVTPIPGTTRDMVESTLYIEGIPLRLVDTAGLRRGKGTLEKIGMERAGKKTEDADLVLVVIDQSRPLHKDDLSVITRVEKKKAILVINKVDLPAKMKEGDLKMSRIALPLVRISALRGDGIDELRKAIKSLILSGEEASNDLGLAPNVRQRQALEEAGRCFTRAFQNLKDGMPLEIMAVDMNEGLAALGEITGETATEEILDRIFSQFCLGK